MEIKGCETEIKYDKMLFVDPKELRLKSGLFPTEKNLTLVIYYDAKRVNSETIGGMALGLPSFKAQIKKEKGISPSLCLLCLQ